MRPHEPLVTPLLAICFAGGFVTPEAVAHGHGKGAPTTEPSAMTTNVQAERHVLRSGSNLGLVDLNPH